MPQFLIDRRTLLKGALASIPLLIPNKAANAFIHGGGSVSYVPPYPPQLASWHTALNKVKSGVSNARILCIGDSTTMGVGSDGGFSGNLIPNSYPSQLSGVFNTNSINAHWNSIVGASNDASPPDRLSNDSRLTKSGAASYLNGGYTTAGGDIFACNNDGSSAGAFGFLPTTNVDTFNLWYAISSSNGNMNLNINGGSNSPFNTNGSNGVGLASITGTVGSNTLNIIRSTGYVSWLGVEAYDSSKKWVSVMNAGWSAAKSGDWNSSTYPWSPINVISNYSPDLTIVMLGINDWDNGISTTVYNANIQAIISAVTTGSVLLVSPPPSNPGTGYGSPSTAVQATYVAKLQSLASANNLLLVDTFNTWGTWANANSNGWMYDGVHPNNSGYAQIASSLFSTINV